MLHLGSEKENFLKETTHAKIQYFLQGAKKGNSENGDLLKIQRLLFKSEEEAGAKFSWLCKSSKFGVSTPTLFQKVWSHAKTIIIESVGSFKIALACEYACQENFRVTLIFA